MGKPDKELKKKILIVGITAAVYGSFRFLLPLVIPFLIAYGFALLLGPSARWVAMRCRTKRKIRGKRRGLPVGLIGAVELVLILFLLITGLYFGGRKLVMEAHLLIEQIPVWLNDMDQWMMGTCRHMETLFALEEEYLVVLVREMYTKLFSSIKHGAMPYVMSNSLSIFKVGMQVVVITIILIIATALSLQEMDRWKIRCDHSVCRQEIAIILRRIKIVCNAYIKTQGIIMLLTMCISMVMFWLLKNPYYILAGVGLGLVDALPILGTGTVLVPWAIISFATGHAGKGFALLLLYVICYFMREVMEAKLMAERVGLSPLETLIAMYVGLQLFGIVGFLLGPVGLLLIMDLVTLLE